MKISLRKSDAVDLQDACPVFKIEDHQVIMRDGRVAVGFEVECVEAERWTPDEYRAYYQQLVTLIQQLPVGTVLHKTDVYYDRPYRVDTSEAAYFERKLHEHFQDRLVLLHRSYLFLSFAPKRRKGSGKPNPFTTLFSGLHKVKNPYDNIERLCQTAEVKSAEFAKSLSGDGEIQLRRLEGADISRLYLQYLNLEFDAAPADVQAEYTNDISALGVGHRRANLISMKGQALQTDPVVRSHLGVAAPMSYPLTQYLQIPHVLSTCIYVEDTPAMLTGLDRARKNNSQLGPLSEQDNELKAESLLRYTAEVRQDNVPLVQVASSILVYDADPRRLAEHVEQVCGAYRSLSIEVLVESFDTAPLFFANLPGAGGQNYRWVPARGDEAVTYMPFITSYAWDKHGEYLCDRFRNPVVVNLFNTQLNNQNFIEVGPSGSGKSYTNGSLITQRFEKGARQIIIDVGGSYRNLLSSLNHGRFHETYFEYDPEDPIGYNPVIQRRQNGRYVLPTDKLNFLIDLLVTIQHGNSDKQLKPADRATYQARISEYYTYAGAHPDLVPSLPSFRSWLLDHHAARLADDEYQRQMRFFDLDEFLVATTPFVSGEYR
ncbi:MAG: hypothetical protein WBA12_00710, partial [Catalinimonas sp.]